MNNFNKWALLIGINRYQNFLSQFQLSGCVNDIEIMSDILKENFGFPEGNITMLRNEEATREGILAALKALPGRVGVNDIVVIQYCGHGSQMRDREGDEPDGWDETIVPCDSGRSPYPNRDITDDEIYMWLLELAEKTANVTLIFDCCHSGTIARDVFGTKSRWIEPDKRSIGELPPSPITEMSNDFRWDAGPSGWLPLSKKYVLAAGCRDDESSYEHNIVQDGQVISHGAFTYFLSQELIKAAPGTTYRDVFERTSAQVTAFHPNQHPQMEGARDKELFGLHDIQPMRFVSVRGRTGSKVTLGGGAAHGMTVRSKWEIYPSGTRQVTKQTPRQGMVEIIDVHAVASDARIIEEIGKGIIGTGSRAIEAEHSYGEMRLKIKLYVPDIYADARNEFSEYIRRFALLSIVETGKAADVCAYVIAPRTGVRTGDPLPQLKVVERPAWAIVGQDGKLIMPVHDIDESGVVSILCENLEKFARYRQVLLLRNPNEESLLKGKVDFILKRQKTDGTWVVAEPDNSCGHIIFEEGERISGEIINRHDSPIYISVLDMGLTGAVDLLYPVAGANEGLEPGRSHQFGVREGDILELYIPSNFPYVIDPSDTISIGGTEIFKLFASTREADFTNQLQAGFRNVNAGSETMVQLLDMAMTGRGSRDPRRSRVSPDEEWTTIERSFFLQRKNVSTHPRSIDVESEKPEPCDGGSSDRSITVPEKMRFIQAQVFEMRKGEAHSLKGAFVKGLKYETNIRIGPPDMAWLAPVKDFPQHLLSFKERNILQVFFSEPNHLPDVQTATIELEQSGPSTECKFSFSVIKEMPVFEGRIIISHKNRILQTALLKGEVVDSDKKAATGRSVYMEVEAVVRPIMSDLSGREKFDMALLVNHGSDNRPRLTKLTDGCASIREIEGIQVSIRSIQDRLENTARAIADAGGVAFRSTQIESLLAFLAYHGRILYDAIITDQVDAGWMPSHPGRVQLVSAHSEAYLPLEFLYDKTIPAPDAKLCPNAEQVLQEGNCQNCILQDDSVNSPYICPAGFWCLSRVIERHAHDTSYGTMVGTSDYVMQAEPVKDRAILNVLQTCLYAASDRVDSVMPGQRQQFLDTLNSVSGNTSMVSMWKDWAKEVSAKHPTLLILMPHTLEDEVLRAPAMEIGSSDRLISGYIKPDYVCISPQAPMVALLGCETMVPYSKYMGFIPQFRRNGAALVLCTLTTVLGRQVVPIAQKLVLELKAELEKGAGRTVSFGDVLLKVRRKVLLQGFPIVLCLIAFGDADWQLKVR